jgi:alcohol dehydrogenase
MSLQTTSVERRMPPAGATRTMRAAVFEGRDRIGIREVPRPRPGPGQALIRVTMTSICGTDLHILKGEYPARYGLILGREPVGIIEALGAGVTGYEVGDRVVVGATTPCGQCGGCLSGRSSQCGGGGPGHLALGGWRLGHTIDGCHAEYLVVPDAQANLAVVPPALSDRDVLLCPAVMSTGFSAIERGQVRLGDAVAVFGQGPTGLCAIAGAQLAGAALVIGVDSVPERLSFARKMGADVVLNHEEQDVPAEIKRLTGGGVDVAVEALGQRDTFRNALRSVRPGGTVASLGVYSRHLEVPLDAIAAGLGDHTIVTSLCPGGKERMRRLMNIVAARRFPFSDLVTHSFRLWEIETAYELFASHQHGVMKISVAP